MSVSDCRKLATHANLQSLRQRRRIWEAVSQVDDVEAICRVLQDVIKAMNQVDVVMIRSFKKKAEHVLARNPKVVAEAVQASAGFPMDLYEDELAAKDFDFDASRVKQRESFSLWESVIMMNFRRVLSVMVVLRCLPFPLMRVGLMRFLGAGGGLFFFGVSMISTSEDEDSSSV